MIHDVIIIGGSASGMMTAIFASRRGKKVLLLEKNEILGRKILATGNGRCNLTNKEISIERFHGGNKLFIQTILRSFTNKDLTNFFEISGLALKEEDKGRIFPRNNQASAVVNTLRESLAASKAIIKTETEVMSILKKDVWMVQTNAGVFYGTKIVLATGGRAAHQFGSSGDGLFWASKLGHSISPIYASLAPIETEEEWIKDVQGVKIEANVSAKTTADKIIVQDSGDVLFTHFGLSGPAVMSVARWIAPLIKKQKIYLSLDLYPERKRPELDSKLEKIFRINAKKNIKNLLSGVVPSNISVLILKLAEIDESKKAANLSKAERARIVDLLKDLKLTVKKLRPLKEAQVTRGGIKLCEVDALTLESKKISGLYFAGEILDVDADSGGFNLQWAWSCGYVAGNNI